MNNDPIVGEIHQIRGRLLAKYNGDLDHLLYRYKQSEDRDRVVTLKDVEERRKLAQQRHLTRWADDSGRESRRRIRAGMAVGSSDQLGIIGKRIWDGCAESRWTVLSAALWLRFRPNASPVFGFTSNRGKFELEMSRRIQ